LADAMRLISSKKEGAFPAGKSTVHTSKWSVRVFARSSMSSLLSCILLEVFNYL